MKGGGTPLSPRILYWLAFHAVGALIERPLLAARRVFQHELQQHGRRLLFDIVYIEAVRIDGDGCGGDLTGDVNLL